MMTTIKPMKSFSTCLLLIRLLMHRPTTPPPMPPATIKMSQTHSKGGTVLVTKVVVRLVIWDTKMMYRLFWAAVLADMEKK